MIHEEVFQEEKTLRARSLLLNQPGHTLRNICVDSIQLTLPYFGEDSFILSSNVEKSNIASKMYTQPLLTIVCSLQHIFGTESCHRNATTIIVRPTRHALNTRSVSGFDLR